MDVRKLINAAKLIENSNSALAQEILKTAQDLNGTNIQTTEQPQVVSQNPVLDPNNLNPNTKNYGNTNTAPQRDSHKITFDIDVTPGFSKVNLVNHLMSALNNHPEIKQNNIQVTGYSFKS